MIYCRKLFFCSLEIVYPAEIYLKVKYLEYTRNLCVLEAFRLRKGRVKGVEDRGREGKGKRKGRG
jgi:hypothetical protein